MAAVIETRGLSKTYRRFRAVSGIDLDVEGGEVFGLLGPNGAGKTTTILMLLGSVRPTDGAGTMLGEPLGHVRTRRRIGFLPEKFQFHDFLTARELLDLHGRLAGLSGPERAKAIPATLERVGLADRANTRLRDFSRGMQQRAGLAQAILHNPELVILDEPTSALDPIGRRDVRDLINSLRSGGATVVLNSHLLSEIEMTCDRVAIINHGKIALQGRVEALIGAAGAVTLEVRGMNDAAMAAVRTIAAKLRLDRVPITRFTAWIHATEDIPALARAVVMNGVDLISLSPARETLEDLYIRTIEAGSV